MAEENEAFSEDSSPEEAPVEQPQELQDIDEVPLEKPVQVAKTVASTVAQEIPKAASKKRILTQRVDAGQATGQDSEITGASSSDPANSSVSRGSPLKSNAISNRHGVHREVGPGSSVGRHETPAPIPIVPKVRKYRQNKTVATLPPTAPIVEEPPLQIKRPISYGQWFTGCLALFALAWLYVQYQNDIFFQIYMQTHWIFPFTWAVIGYFWFTGMIYWVGIKRPAQKRAASAQPIPTEIPQVKSKGIPIQVPQLKVSKLAPKGTIIPPVLPEPLGPRRKKTFQSEPNPAIEQEPQEKGIWAWIKRTFLETRI